VHDIRPKSPYESLERQITHHGQRRRQFRTLEVCRLDTRGIEELQVSLGSIETANQTPKGTVPQMSDEAADVRFHSSDAMTTDQVPDSNGGAG
jgi:hypothetical protein